MKSKAVKAAFFDTLPVMTGYVFLGFGFGILMYQNGYGLLWSVSMSLFIYAGSMQYVAVSLLTAGASLLTAALTTFVVNARHLFYGISMLEKYQNTGKAKPYLIFALTDETSSLVCGELPNIPPEEQVNYRFLISILNHLYWIIGSVAGAVAGSLIQFNSQGIDFALTALFLTVFTDQWLTSKRHGPALIGLGASVASLLLFGGDNFLIPAMTIIALALCLYKKEENNA